MPDPSFSIIFPILCITLLWTFSPPLENDLWHSSQENGFSPSTGVIFFDFFDFFDENGVRLCFGVLGDDRTPVCSDAEPILTLFSLDDIGPGLLRPPTILLDAGPGLRDFGPGGPGKEGNIGIYDNTRRNLKQRWVILATEKLTTIVTHQFLVNTVLPVSRLLQL